MTVQQAIEPVLLASVMAIVFRFGLQTTLGDVLYVVRRPSLLGRSLVAMFVVMPIIALALVRAFALRPAVEIVLVALSISPIPPILPGRGARAGGKGSYALGLLMIVGLLSIVTVPAAVELLGRYLSRPLAIRSGVIANIVLKMAVLPLAAGLVCRALWPSVAARLAKPIGLVATVLLAIGVLGIVAGTLPELFALIGNGTVVAMAAFVVVGLAVGHWLGGPEADDRPVLALCTASRHPAIALTIAKVNFPDEPHLGAAVLLFLLVNLLVAIPYQSRQRKRRAAAVSDESRA